MKTARELMEPAVTVAPDATVRALADLLLDRTDDCSFFQQVKTAQTVLDHTRSIEDVMSGGLVTVKSTQTIR